MSEQNSGTIIRALSGFYDVDTGSGIIRCRHGGREAWRLRRWWGIRRSFQPSGDSGYLQEIAPKKQLYSSGGCQCGRAGDDGLSGQSGDEPFLIDRVAAIAAAQGVDTLLLLTKCDLDPAEELYAIYQQAGIPVIRTSTKNRTGHRSGWRYAQGRAAAFTGNSGVGKSTMLNALYPEANMETGEVSDKLGRGRHTTRHVELFTLPDGTESMDTPGLRSLIRI